MAKSGILDKDFYHNMLEVCDTEEEKGLISVLYYSGMHGSSLRTLTTDNLKKEGKQTNLRWRRTKTGKTVECRIPASAVGMVTAYLLSTKKSTRWTNYRLCEWGNQAGYDNVSTMTFRHTRCLTMIRQGRSVFEIAQKMGCSQDVVWRNYSKFKEDQLGDE